MSNGKFLDWCERAGNRLPDPVTLFFAGAAGVVVLSAVAVGLDWSVTQALPRQTPTGVVWEPTGQVFSATNLFSRDGIYWMLKNLVKNFMAFPPLGVVLVGMLGIGVAERVGLIAALLKCIMRVVPDKLLTPTMIFAGIMSSMTLDAGYVVLPPLAAALYQAAGRSPVAGLAAVFAGVAAGFNANLFITGLDPMLAGLATTGAQVVDPDYVVNPACNWWFMIASTVVITLTGWWVNNRFVERRLATKPPTDGGPPTETAPADCGSPETDTVDCDNAETDPVDCGSPETDPAVADASHLSPADRRGLRQAAVIAAVCLGLIAAAIFVPGAPLHTYSIPDASGTIVMAERVPAGVELPAGAWQYGDQWFVKSTEHFARWVGVIVPLLFLAFLLPALWFGRSVGNLRSDRDLAKLLTESMAAMAPIIVLAFAAAQFIAWFKHSGLGVMLATAGGQFLGKAALPTWLLIIAFILLTGVFNLMIGSMSAKYAMFAPIFIPMLMLVGISPELTQAAYRIGDSVTNVITPLNPYMVIILVFMQKYVPKGRMGTLVAMMLPYTIAFAIVWTIMLLVWLNLGIPLGPGGALNYTLP